MKAADIFRGSIKQSRRLINPPYKAHELLIIAGTLIVLLAIPLTVISVYQAGGLKSRAQQLVQDNIEETIVAEGMLTFKGKMARIGDLSVLLYRKDTLLEWWAYFRDDSGNESRVQLPGFTIPDQTYKGEYVLTSKNELWIFSGAGPIVARRYQLIGSPLPTSANLISSQSFGDSDSRAGSFIKLASGGLIGVWYQWVKKDDNSIDYGIAYRDPSGNWSSIFPLNVEGIQGNIPSTYISLAQHPVDGSIWMFSKRDSYHQIEAIHLTETGSGINLDWVDNNFIGEQDGDNRPEGEHPDIQAVPDPTRNVILLAYQSKQYKFFSFSPIVKGAYVRIAKIQTDGTKSFIPFNTYIERVLRLGLVARPDKIWLAYRPIDETDLTYDDIYVSSYDGSSWSNQILLGTLSNPMSTIAFGVEKPQFAIQETDNNIHFFEIQSSATPGDLNGDGKVNIFDASIMTSKWGTNDPTADLNGDGTVNIFDASILTANWTG